MTQLSTDTNPQYSIKFLKMNDPARWLSFGIAFQTVCHPQQQQLSVLDEWVHIYILKKL